MTSSRTDKFNDAIEALQKINTCKAIDAVIFSKSFKDNGGWIDQDGLMNFTSNIGLVKGYFALAEYLETDLLICKLIVFGKLQGIVTRNGRAIYQTKGIERFNDWGNTELQKAFEFIRDNPKIDYKIATLRLNKILPLQLQKGIPA